MRIFSAFAFAIGCLAAVACSSSSNASSDPASCNVVVTSYDQTCTQDSDCVGAPPGGDACGECATGNPAFVCTLAAINTKDSARYQNDLANAIKSSETTSTCGTSCPVPGKPTCVDNVCKLVAASSDAGS